MHFKPADPQRRVASHLREVEGYFSRNAGDWEATYRDRSLQSYNFRARAAAALGMLQALTKQSGPGRLLEVGCGAGIQAAAADAAGWRVVGVDLSVTMLRHATANVRRGLWVAASGDALPFRPGSFDAAMMLGVIGYLPDPMQCLNEVRASLRPGGFLVISTLVSARRLLDRLSGIVSAVPDRIYLKAKALVVPAAPAPANAPTAPSFFRTHNARRTGEELEALLARSGWAPLNRRAIHFGVIRFMGKRLWPQRVDEALSGLITQVSRLPGTAWLRRMAMTVLVLARNERGHQHASPKEAHAPDRNDQASAAAFSSVR